MLDCYTVEIEYHTGKGNCTCLKGFKVRTPTDLYEGHTLEEVIQILKQDLEEK